MADLNKIRAAFPEFQDTSDAELIGLISKKLGAPVGDISDMLGIAPRGVLAETGRQIAGGLVSDLPSMAGQTLKYFSEENSPAYNYGQEMVQNAEKRGIGFEPDIRGRGALGKAAVYGGRGLAPAAAVIGTAFIPGVGEVVAPVAAATLYGGSSAQDTYEKILEQTGDKEAASAAARRVGLIQGAGEAAATFVGGRAVKGIGTALGIGGEKTVEGVARGLTDTAVAKPFLRSMAENVVVQPLTEVAQDVGTYAVEQAYGAKKEDPYAIAEQSALGGLGLTMLLGPFSIGGHVRRAQGAQVLKDLLDPESTAPLEDRLRARQIVMQEAKRQGVADENIDSWFNDQMMLEDKRIAAQQKVDQELAGMGTDLTAKPGDYMKRINNALLETFDPVQELKRRADEGRPMSEAEASKYLSSFAAAQQAGQEFQDLMASQDERLARVQGLGKQWQDLQGQKAAGLMAAQEAGDQARGITGRLEAEAAQQEAPIVSLLRASSGAENLEGLTKGAGTKADFMRITNPEVMSPITTPEVQLPAARAQLLQQPSVPMSNIRLDRPTQEVGQAAVPITERPPILSPGVTPGAVQPATPVVAGTFSQGKSSGTKAPQTKQAKTQGQELSPAESEQLSKLLSDVDKTDVGDVLPASVKSNKNAVPGKTSIGQDTLKRIRDALVLGKEVADEQSARVVEALQNFASSYKVYSDQGGQALSRRNKIAKRSNAAQFADEQASGIEMQAANVQQALGELGNAVGGNAKDVEAVVRLVKDMVQGKVVAPGKSRGETIKALKKLDTMLSQAWGAAKREAFMGKQPDTADIRTGAIRGSIEVKGKGKMPTLVKIAKEGINAGADLGTLKGLPAILHYMRTNGTPMERALALALRESITQGESDIKLEFITEGKPRFDPKTNTVYINQEESPEVILHEAFHAALQSFVYKNPNHPAVVQLKKSLKSVIGYKGELTGKALEVQNLLKGLMADGNELDAVLELVSYGNTLNEFRKALQSMKGDKKIPASFLESVNKAWTAIKQIASRLLGGKQSLASDVLQSSLELLEKASKQTAVTGQGNVLEASVKSEPSVKTPVAEAIESEVAKSTATNARAAGYPDLRTYMSSQASWRTPTRIFFEYLGFGEKGATTAKIREAGMESAAVIRKHFPTLERVILNINSRFSNPEKLNTLIEYFKTHQNTGILQMERVVQYLQFNPTMANAVLDYLDGKADAFKGAKNEQYIVAVADNVKAHLQEYIDSLPRDSKERQLFESLKFTEYLLNPKSIAQLATKSFGLQKLTKLLGIERRKETSIDAFKSLLPTKDGSLDFDAPLYQTFETYTDNDGNNIRVPSGFIGKELAETNPPAGMDIERSRVWKLEKYAGKDYHFVSRVTTKNEIREMADKQKTDELAAALMNTMAALSHNYAGRNFFNGMATIGREDGNATASTVVFNDVDEINKVFGGKAITDENVLNVNDEASKTALLRWKLQRTGTWVRLPSSESYGNLAGKIISGPVWNSMVDMHDRSPLIKAQALNNVMTWFKKAKTVYTPATHVNNILSNYALMQLHGLSHKALVDAASLFSRFELNPKSLTAQETATIKAFLASGAVLGQYTQTEAKQTIAKALVDNLTPDDGKSFMDTLVALAKVEKQFAIAQKHAATAKRYGKNADTVVTELYAAGDNIFRLAAFMNTAANIQVRDGSENLSQKQLEEAGIAARKMFLDYDVDARFVRAARQSALPFISWTYAILPVLGRLAIEKPWTMVNMMAALAVMSSMSGGDDDDEIRKALPEQVREKFLGVPMFFRVPFMGDDENPVYYNIGKSIPMMSVFQPSPQKARGILPDWAPGFLNPSGPYINLVAAAFLGIDTFTGKPISNETDDNWDRFANGIVAMYDTMTPSFGTSRFLGQLKDWTQEKEGPTGKKANGLFLARTLGGLSLYEFNVQESLYFQDLQVKKLKSDFKAAMNKAKREEMSKGYPDYEALDKELDRLSEKLEKRIAEIRGEE